MTDRADILAARLAPFREAPGMLAAMLISRDGFVVAADVGPGFHADAFAAHAGGIIEITGRLASELGERAAKYIAVEFEDKTMVLAPFSDELLLALVGERTALSCQYHLSRPAS